ncbi:alpha/beta hydrolase family protein [Brevibacillus sp. 179-C9.3 HS]|uniref:alpha/beta hydrolase family protein n=1 Tax=unclassified Brevibacillus TaxID=2684853 RepID=UPI0039A07E61
MRIFEVMFVILAIGLLWYLIWSRKAPGRLFLWGMPIVLVGTGLFHLIFEKARWQMGPAYLVALIALCMYAARAYRNTIKDRAWKKSLLLSVPAFLLSTIAICLPFLLPVFSFERPTGAHRVGTANYTWSDNSRIGSDGTSRKINVQIWYPTDSSSSATPGKYISNLPAFAKAVEEQYGFAGKVLSYLEQVETHTYAGASFAADLQEAPVIFLSHGNMLGSRFTNTFQAIELASHGYIVAAVEHPGTAMLSVYPDGSYAPFIDTSSHLPMKYNVQNDASIPVIKEQTQDIEFALQQLMDMSEGVTESPFIHRADFSSVGIIGHSFGGATAVDVLYNNPAFKAGINMDGYLYGEERDKPITQPLMIMNGGFTLTELEDSPEMKLAEEERRERVLAQSGVEVDIRQAGHLSFTDFPLYSPLMEALSPEVRRNHSIINELSRAFMDRNLKGNPNISYLDVVERYPDVTIRMK